MNKLPSSAKNSDVDGFAASVVNRFDSDENAKKNTFLLEKMTALKARREEMNAAILRENVTSGLTKLDKVRSADFRAVMKFANAYMLHPDEKVQKLNEPVLKVLKKYQTQGILTANYKSKVSLFDSMKRDLEPYADNIAKIDAMAALFERMWTHEAECVAANEKYVEDKNNKPTSATKLRSDVLDLVNNMLVPFLSGQLVQRDADTSAFATYFAEEIERTREGHRTQKKEKNKAESAAGGTNASNESEQNREK